MHAKVHSAQIIGIQALLVEVEVDISRGLHSFSIVGLPDKVVEESRERISAAIKNSGYKSPQKGSRRIIVSLAPADIKKEGPLFDLPIALGTLLASGDIKFNTEEKLFLGELALDGELRPIRGALLITQMAQELGFKEIYLPKENTTEAALIEGIKIYGARNLKEVVAHLDETSGDNIPRPKIKASLPTKITPSDIGEETLLDFADIKGQETAKRGLEIAAAGGHNIALIGPPGVGKTLLAKAFPGLLPPLNFEEMIEVTGIHSSVGRLNPKGVVITPPYKSPHHTSSYVSLVGGGTWPRPGEITLAHRGVLFLDEFPEFEKRVIDSLRQPLEEKTVNISRAKDSVTFPADFVLIAAMNLCPCGNKGLSKKECVCNPSSLMRYKRKVSGPIMDRIDLWIYVPEVPIAKLSDSKTGESSATIRKRIIKCRELQKQTFKKNNITLKTIAGANPKQIKKLIILAEAPQRILNEFSEKLGLSARGYHKTLKLAHTIANLEGENRIGETHILEALQYKPKELWF